MSRFFIDRPIFAWVLGLVLMLGGAIEIYLLPVAQFPSIAAPQVSITVTYPGASAQTVQDTVVQPILQQMSGLDGLEYIASSTRADGSMEIDFTFVQGTDPNIAQVQVQNNLSLAEALLPSVVTQQGIKVKKSVKNFMLAVGLVSTDGSMSADDTSDYIASHLQDPLSRVPGVGDFSLFGTEYAMRIWLDPDKLYKYSLTVGDVTGAISAQNVQVSSGELGGVPARKGQRIDAAIIGPSRFEKPEQFENILLKVNQDGSQVRLRDVARVELGAQAYTPTSLIDGKPASALALKLSPGANQLSTEAAVKAELTRLSQFFPPGLKIVYPLDTEPFITLSLTEVVKTLFEAIVLVFVVIFVFLQNFRATLIPTIAVPIVLLGTFAVLAAFGYSINTLTMLAMVLAVGLLVDDAIVVVENVERVMSERGLSSREAARQSMDEISGALAQISLVAQVGSEYLTWLADRDSLAVSEDTARLQADSLRLTQTKAARGEATGQDVAQAETTLRSAEASVAQFTRQVAQDMDELVLLVGAPLPEALVARMDAEAGLGSQPVFPELPAGLPADLLERRPDIRAAEHTLLAANANIGAARAAFFPQITLTGQYGTASSDLKHLFSPGSSAWLFAPSLSLPIFDAGRNQANLDIAKVAERSEVASYEKAIQSAFHDVADALAGRSWASLRLISVSRALNSAFCATRTLR
jgi:hypothetical protein